MNLNPVAISNCINGTQVGLSVAGVFNGAALSGGGTEYVVDTHSTPGQVYYVGVKSEDQMASEYAFIGLFTAIPFSQMNNGNEIVNGLPVPVAIPDGTPGYPGFTNVLGIAIYPITVGRVVVNNTVATENFGDLVGTVTLNNNNPVVLNSHDGFYDPSGIYPLVYDDSGQTDIPNSRPSDGPGSLRDYLGGQGNGVWMLTEADTAPAQNGSVSNFSLVIQPQAPLTSGVTNNILPRSWFYDFVDVPAGATNLTINATNLTASITIANEMVDPLQLVIKFGSKPTLTNADKGPVALTNGQPFSVNGIGLTSSLSVGLTDVPPIRPGRYWIGVWNPSFTITQTVGLGAVILPANPNPATTDFASAGPTQILDDAVTNSDIPITNGDPRVTGRLCR